MFFTYNRVTNEQKRGLFSKGGVWACDWGLKPEPVEVTPLCYRIMSADQINHVNEILKLFILIEWS